MIPSAEGVSNRSVLPHQEAPTAITSRRPAASITVQRMFIHMLSRMPRKTTPAMNRRKPSESKVGWIGASNRRSRFSATTRDWVATEVRPDIMTASPTIQVSSGRWKVRCVM